MKRRTQLITITLAVLLAWAGTAVAADPAAKCQATKDKVAGKYYACRLKAEAKAALSGEPADHVKCMTTFLTKWGSAETKGAGACPDNVTLTPDMDTYLTDRATEAAAIIAGTKDIPMEGVFPASGQTTAFGVHSDGYVEAGATLSYTDNGDGTITDNNTGLMWEKKSNDGSVHDKDNTYTWGNVVNMLMTGTIVTDFLATLNSDPCFAGYCDWRIPNYKELVSILNLERSGPAVDPAFHNNCTGTCTVTTCSCTSYAHYYWSSTTVMEYPYTAWGVDFNLGVVSDELKDSSLHVRAVRGGLGL